MKISDLIARLEEVKAKHGDLMILRAPGDEQYQYAEANISFSEAHYTWQKSSYGGFGFWHYVSYENPTHLYLEGA